MGKSSVYIIMGVSGSGKTTIGRILAARLDCPFFDADNFHPPENVAKMAAGLPLNDTDRAPWLDSLRTLISNQLQAEETAVLACSALKKSYRDRLRKNNEGVYFIHLDGSFEIIWQRMQGRKNHFMKAEMLKSQFATLEPPSQDEAIVVNVHRPIKTIVREIISRIAGQ